MSERNFLYNLADNFIGYDDGVTTPGERFGAGANALATSIYNDPIGLAFGIGNDLNQLMFQGGAMQRPEDVIGYAAAPMAPGAVNMLRNTPNVTNAITAYHGSPHDFDKFSMDETPNGYMWFSGDKGYAEGIAGRTNLSRQKTGATYEVDIDMKNPLVVDTPAEARRVANEAGIDIQGMEPEDIEYLLRGGENFETLVNQFKVDMNAGGHDGILFKDTYDGYSRPTDQMVVFDENLINIVRKYGIAGAATALGVSASDVQAAMAQGQQQ